MAEVTQARIAVIIKTFLRDDCLMKLVDSLEDYCNIPYRLYIADEEPVSDKKRALFEGLEEDGHHIMIFDEAAPVAVTRARNVLLSNLSDEPFVLRLDDDFVLTEETRIDVLMKILETRREVGAVSGVEIQGITRKRTKKGGLSSGQGHVAIDRRKRRIIKTFRPVDSWMWLELDGIRFAYADFTRNFLLIRREAAEQVRWNEALRVEGEHVDFMLRLKEAGWALAFTPDSIHVHDEPPPRTVSSGYKRQRSSADGSAAVAKTFEKQWGVSEVYAVSDVWTSEVATRAEALKRVVKRLLKVVRVR